MPAASSHRWQKVFYSNVSINKEKSPSEECYWIGTASRAFQLSFILLSLSGAFSVALQENPHRYVEWK